MLAWLAPIIVFGVVVFVHELGHFLAAKAVGVYAPRFSIGFGPALWRRRWGETEYVIAALPLGGYVRMASREDESVAFLEGGSEETRAAEVGANGLPGTVGDDAGAARPRDWDPNALKPFGPKDVPQNRLFESKPLVARLFILLAGVTMNAVLALVVATGLFAGYGRAYVPAVVDSVVAGRPAARAGLQHGDSIVAVDGTPVHDWGDVVERITASAGRALAIEVVRTTGRQTIRVTPEAMADTNLLTGRQVQVGRIGAAPTPKVLREPMAFGESVQAGWTTTWTLAGSVVSVVTGLFSGGVSVSQLGGPIAIGRASVQAAKSGIESLLSLVAFLSINIAVLNLLPVPVLDGGQVLINILEAARGSAFSARTREYILRFGLAVILLLFVLVMFNDIKGLADLFG
jgi:regulator of sigma E protease